MNSGKPKPERRGTSWKISAENGENALRLVSLHRPHIVLMDIVMPVMDGLQAAERMKLLYPDLHIVLYTGHPKERFQQRARELGIDAIYMKEELTISELQRLISRWSSTVSGLI